MHISCLDDHIFIYINVRGIESRQNDIGAFQKIDPRMYALNDNCRYRDYSRNEKNGHSTNCRKNAGMCLVRNSEKTGRCESSDAQ